MPHLAEHIASLESEIALMTQDGHHIDPQVRAALERFDVGIGMLHAAKCRQLVEGTSEPPPRTAKPARTPGKRGRRR